MTALYTQIQHIVSIQVFDKRVDNNYTYTDKVVVEKTYKTWLHRLFFSPTISKIRKVGFTEARYNNLMRAEIGFVEPNEIKSRGRIVDYAAEKVYYKPYIKFTFSNKDVYTKDFESIKELNLFLNPITQKNKELIKIIDNETKS